MVHVNMLEGVPGVFALLCAVKNQRHQISVAADDLTGVDAAHHLKKHSRQTASGTFGYMSIKVLSRSGDIVLELS